MCKVTLDRVPEPSSYVWILGYASGYLFVILKKKNIEQITYFTHSILIKTLNSKNIETFCYFLDRILQARWPLIHYCCSKDGMRLLNFLAYGIVQRIDQLGDWKSQIAIEGVSSVLEKMLRDSIFAFKQASWNMVYCTSYLQDVSIQEWSWSSLISLHFNNFLPKFMHRPRVDLVETWEVECIIHRVSDSFFYHERTREDFIVCSCCGMVCIGEEIQNSGNTGSFGWVIWIYKFGGVCFVFTHLWNVIQWLATSDFSCYSTIYFDIFSWVWLL